MVSRLVFAFVAAVSLAAPMGCGEEFDPASRVTDFRLLAVQADKPYAAPGEEVQLTTLSHEPFGRPITWAWTTCVKPDDTTVNACLAKIVQDARIGGGQLPVSVGPGRSTFKTVIPANVLDGVDPRAAGNVLVGVLTVACPGELGVEDLGTVTPGDLPFRCLDANTKEVLPYERYVVSVKRIYVRRTERNQNPVLAGVTWDGQPWAENDIKEVTPCSNDPVVSYADCSGGESHDLAVIVPPQSIEAGTSELGAAFKEDMVASYYATEGVFEFSGRTVESPTTSWKARSAAAGKEQTLWFVVRENRGGVSWTTRKVRVR